MNKKIFMIGWEYPPNITGGLGIACQGLAFSLAKKGIPVQFLVPKLFGNEKTIPGMDLFSVSGKKNIFSKHELEYLERKDKSIRLKEEPILVTAYGKYGEPPTLLAEDKFFSETNESISLTTISDLSGGYTAEIFSEINRYAMWASAIAEKLDFDIIHCHDWMTFPAGLAVAQKTGKPLICHVHSTEIDRSGQHVNQRTYELEREAIHKCNLVITVSDFTKSILMNHYGLMENKIRTVHNGVDFELHMEDLSAIRNQRKIGPKEKLVLFMGRITFQKGPDYFVRAAKRVLDVMPNVRFIMAGTGDMYHRMIEMAADLGIGKYFHYTGFLQKDQVSKLLKTVDLYVMPSVSEPFGIVSLEAMVHEVPVIMSKQSGVSEVIANSIKVNFWDVDEMAEKMIHVLGSESLHTELKQEGKREAIEVSWERASNKVISIYDSLA